MTYSNLKFRNRGGKVYWYLNHEGQRIQGKTDVLCPESAWDKGSQRCKPGTKFTTMVNNRLEAILESYSVVTEGYLARHGDLPGSATICKSVGKIINGEEVVPTYLAVGFNKMVEERESGKELKADGSLYSHNRILQYKNLAKYLDKTKYHAIDKVWVKDWLGRLSKEELSTNTMATYLSILKAHLDWARDLGCKVPEGAFSMKLRETKTEHVYSGVDELEAIYELKLDGNMDIARDLMLIGSFTALRASDLYRIKEANYVGRLLTIKTKKTGQTVTVPMHQIVSDIFRKYQGNIPTLGNSEKSMVAMLGRYMKKIYELAGITETVLIDGVKKRKCDVVSTHTCRRSGATNMLLSGIEKWRVMLITGHKTESSFNRYVNISTLENAYHLRNEEFFNLKKVI